MARFEKDFRHLCRNIDSISANQARINVENVFNGSDDSSSPRDSSSDQSFYLEISPHEGPYAYASYVFHIEASRDGMYPEVAPMVSCLTRIYHPNIDTCYGNYHDNTCVSTLNDWNEGTESSLEDLVQGLLFLFYSPNLEDPLTSNIDSDYYLFVSNVRQSIRGGEIEDFDNRTFEMNYGYKRYLVGLWKRQTDQENFDDAFLNLTLEETDNGDVPSEDELNAFADLLETSLIHSIHFNKLCTQS